MTTEAPTLAAAATLTLAQLPALGAALCGGLFAGVCTRKDGTHCAVVLLADKADGRLTWKKAMNWAERIEADLPTRPVAALLFANVGDQFEKAWHWTSEPCEWDGSYAWDQSFGGQSSGDKSYEGHARAVRLIPLTA